MVLDLSVRRGGFFEAIPTPDLDVKRLVADHVIEAIVLLKRRGGATYLFATQMRGGMTTATFTLARFPSKASAEVLGESRTVPVTGGVFMDDFQAYGVHLYKITY